MFSWFERFRLVERRTVWCPTWLGTSFLLLLVAVPAAWWGIRGEAVLSSTQRTPAEVLVVEGWIGREGIHSAAVEFNQGGYQYVVATGGVASGKGWGQSGWSYAEEAEHELVRSGVPEGKIIVAPSRGTENQRTYESALAVLQALDAKQIHPRALNVFTLGPHAKRSGLVFAKVLGPAMKVGVVSWIPFDYQAVPWWRSSDRAKALLTETAGYLYEFLFNSGRGSGPAVANRP